MIELTRIAFRNVRRRRKRAFLTILGVFIGIAAVVSLVSLGGGLQKTVNDQFEKVGADKIVVQAKERGFTGENAPGQITVHDLDVVDNAVGVVERAGVLFRGVFVEFNGLQRTHFVMSLPSKKREADLVYEFTTWKVDEGRALTHKDKGKVVVGYNFANKELFGKHVRVGNKLRIAGEPFNVVGAFKRTGDPGMDGGLLISEDDARRVMNESGAFSWIVARSARGEDPEVVASRIKRALRRDRHLDEGQEDFKVETSSDLIESFNSVLDIIQFVFIGIALISLLVGGIGIMNTMYTAVLERTREIGVMKAVGARNGDVLGLFLLESGFLGLTGGAVGVLIGIGISKGVEMVVNKAFGPGTIAAFFPWYLIVGVLLFSFVVGTASGLMPARRASRLKPVEALRYE